MTYKCVFDMDFVHYLMEQGCKIADVRHREDKPGLFFIFEDADKCDKLLRELAIANSK